MHIQPWWPDEDILRMNWPWWLINRRKPRQNTKLDCSKYWWCDRFKNAKWHHTNIQTSNLLIFLLKILNSWKRECYRNVIVQLMLFVWMSLCVHIAIVHLTISLFQEISMVISFLKTSKNSLGKSKNGRTEHEGDAKNEAIKAGSDLK